MIAKKNLFVWLLITSKLQNPLSHISLATFSRSKSRVQQQQQWQQRLLHSMSEGRRLRGPQPNQTQQIRVFSHDGSAEQLQESQLQQLQKLQLRNAVAVVVQLLQTAARWRQPGTLVHSGVSAMHRHTLRWQHTFATRSWCMCE